MNDIAAGAEALEGSTLPKGMVELKSGESGPSLFLVPGLGGKVDGFEMFGALLETPMPVIGIEARGLDGSSTPLTEVGNVVSHNLAQIKAVQPSGPYFLLGHSYGGIVAFEMARRLIEMGEPVAWLALLDTGMSQKYWPFSYYLKDLYVRFRRHTANISALPAKEKRRYITQHIRKLVRKLYDPYGLRKGGLNVMIGDRIAYDSYCPEFYPSKLIFFRATIHEFPADPNALWLGRVQELEIHSAPGGHNSMLGPPHVAPLAEEISSCLASARAAPPALN